jgi:hypothetical protein
MDPQFNPSSNGTMKHMMKMSTRGSTLGCALPTLRSSTSLFRAEARPIAFIQALRRRQVSPYYAIISTHPVALEAMLDRSS